MIPHYPRFDPTPYTNDTLRGTAEVVAIDPEHGSLQDIASMVGGVGVGVVAGAITRGIERGYQEIVLHASREDVVYNPGAEFGVGVVAGLGGAIGIYHLIKGAVLTQMTLEEYDRLRK